MQIGDHLGFAGLVVAVLGIGITIRWPNKRWIAYPCFFVAVLLGAFWIYSAHWESTRSKEAPVGRARAAVQADAAAKGIAVQRAETREPTAPSPIRVPAKAPIVQSNIGGCNQQVIGGSNNSNICNEPPRVTASAQAQQRTGDAAIPWETVFTIQTSALTQTGDLRLKCTGPVVRAGISRINPMMFASGSNGPDPTDPTTVIYQLNQDTLAPGRLVTVAVFSVEPVVVLSGTIGPNAIYFPPGKR